jgi:tetratricopeptide (TPR) repeat protein
MNRVGRWPGWFVSLAMALLAACSGAAGRLDRGNELRRAGKPHEALEEYRELLSTFGDGTLTAAEGDLRLRALESAADVTYLELADFVSAVSYYRRIISLYPGTPAAYHARAMIGDIYRDRLKDHHGAIAQYADIAASDTKDAPMYQMRVAREYLELKNYEQARTEAGTVRERWPRSALADEAQLLTAQAWALEKRWDEALGAFRATIDRKPKPEIVAQALEGQAQVYAQMGGVKNLERAIELYTQALPSHPNPDGVRMDLDAVRRRREAFRTVKPGDRDASFDRNVHGRWSGKEVQ